MNKWLKLFVAVVLVTGMMSAGHAFVFVDIYQDEEFATVWLTQSWPIFAVLAAGGFMLVGLLRWVERAFERKS